LPVLLRVPRGSRRQGRARGALRRAPRVGCAEPVTAALPRGRFAAVGNPAHEAVERPMSAQVLFVRNQQNEFIPATPEAILAAAREHLRNRLRRGAALTAPGLVRNFLTVTLAARDCEYFCLLLLDAQKRFLRFVELFRGTIDRANVHPREVVKLVLESQAAAVVFVHNHPSQVAEPSGADELITRRLKEALALIDVPVIDHLIVTADEITSFAERGLL
jgi:DNA repair protein RadC